jgi:hypothetical protein
MRKKTINLQFLELQEQRSLKRHKADGDTEIKEICSNMTDALAKIKEICNFFLLVMEKFIRSELQRIGSFASI